MCKEIQLMKHDVANSPFVMQLWISKMHEETRYLQIYESIKNIKCRQQSKISFMEFIG